MPWGGFVKSQEIKQVWAQGGDFFPNTLRQACSAVGKGARQISSSLRGRERQAIRFPDTNLNDNDY
ncbi:hypothetical protein [Klebsiella pneumoniae ISC21]|nr:hypothetical protein [Klebsiella pneumoniae ISC21]